MNLQIVAGLAAVALMARSAPAQSACSGTPLAGTVRDTTAALIPGATVSLDGVTERSSGQDGRFRFACVAAGPHVVAVTATGFARGEVSVRTPRAADVELRLAPSVESSVTVDAGSADEANTTSSGAMAQTISGDTLQTLADDPDDLQRELQQLAAAAGGAPGNTTISVDGFQNNGTLPPKSSIAYVKVNPDLFSAEYREPPFEGGRVEVYTKPGASAFHGALFTTDSSQWMNARDPFSVSRAAIGKQRYGFELTGPIRKKGSNFSVNLEHRSIDNFAVVNAVTLDASGNAQSTVANVATPQRLWVGQARVDWQLGPKNIFFVSYSANVNHLGNVGVGGTTLAESGYDSGTYDHTVRFSNVTTASAKLVHEARVSVDWTGETDTPVSTAPQVQVAGSFTGGGATIGSQKRRELFTEWDDDVIVSAKKHLVKAGWQFLNLDMHYRLPTNFNGTYVFGGGVAPVLNASNAATGQTATISGLEQYRRALLGLPGGTPTAFTNVAGNPEIDFNQVRLGAFVQDDWTVRPNLHLSFGMRYFMQNDPLMLNGATPRLGVTWVPDKKKTWELTAHAGLFAGYAGWARWSEIRRLDGVERVSSTVYNPVYGRPSSAATAPIYTERTLAPDFRNGNNGIAQIGLTKHLPGGWNLTTMLIGARIWSDARSLNVNTPLNGDPQGPRPGTPNLNVLQLQNSGWGLGDIEFASVSNNALKRLQFFYGAVRINIRDDSDDNMFFSPQSAYTDAGEFSRRTGNSLWQTFGNAMLKLPGKVQVSANFFGSADQPYNITTGFDNNGDGNFNDRPQFAAAGQSGAVATPYGLLTASGGTGVLRRNLGNMPWNAHLDANVQRSWGITRDKKAEHQQSVTANVRSSNLINHTNVMSVGGVLGSPLFGVPYAADNGRRVEGGLRYSF